MDSGGVVQPGLFGRGSRVETRRIVELLRKETIGGFLLLAAAAIAVVWANSPWSSTYESLVRTVVGPGALHLELSVAQWASDGLLAVFFFVAGLEFKREFVAGDLREPRRAAVPIAAALGGVLVPAVIYVAVTGDDVARGWAVPTATDIAFALAVLAVIGTHLPAAMRTFLLALAVVDDLIAVVVIAVFYTDDLRLFPLLLALLPLAVFAVLVRRGVRVWWLLLPLAVLVWVLVHASGVHATAAGILLAFVVPVLRGGDVAAKGPAELFEHRFRPLSAGVAVPVFAFTAAGVPLGGLSGVGEALADPVVLGVVAGLVVGKALGVFGATFLVSRYTRADLDDDLAWVDVAGLAVLAGVGFTVSLLIGGLAFAGTGQASTVKVAVLLGSVTAAALASVILRVRNRVYRRLDS